MTDSQPRSTQFVRRSLVIAAIGVAALGAAAWLPGLRTPWLLSVGALALTLGVLSWAAAGSANAVVRVYGPLGAALAVSYGVDAIARGGSRGDGLTQAGLTAVILVGLIGALELLERKPWRARPTAPQVGNRDQQPNDR